MIPSRAGALYAENTGTNGTTPAVRGEVLMARRVAGTVVIAPLVVALVVMTLAGCGPTPVTPAPGKTTSAPAPADVSEHESGPESPIAYGFQVPRGASQIGPLIRYRSAKLLRAYKPELDAAQAMKDANQQRKHDEAQARGTQLETSTPTPTTAPTSDTFDLLSDPPKPDTTISLMRVSGSPTTVLRAMLAQIDVILPKAGIVRSNIGKYCASEDRRITGCSLSVKGKTRNGRALAVTLAVDPGDATTRVGPPATNQRPVMFFRVAYIGDPRDGQMNRQHDSDVSVPTAVRTRDKSGLIWPRMDEDAKVSSDLLNGWHAPTGAEVLLSAYHPAFVVLTTTRANDASNAAEKFAQSVQEEPQVDVVQDLNEIVTTYTATDAEGKRALASFILSARGYYAVLFFDPPAVNPAPTPTPTPLAGSPTIQVAN